MIVKTGESLVVWWDPKVNIKRDSNEDIPNYTSIILYDI